MLPILLLLGIFTLGILLASAGMSPTDEGRPMDGSPARRHRQDSAQLNCARTDPATMLPRLFGWILAIGMLLGACRHSFGDGKLESICRTDSDCKGDLECEQLQAIGYWGGLDSGGGEDKVCTTACTTNRDCPSRREAPCGVMEGTCEDGWCRVLTICEG